MGVAEHLRCQRAVPHVARFTRDPAQQIDAARNVSVGASRS